MTKAARIARLEFDVLASLPAANDLISLPAIRRRLRVGPDLLDFGTFSDMTAAMNAALVAATAEGWRRVFVPRGVWVQNSAPNVLDRGMLYEGEDRSSTVVSVNHAGSGFYFTGQNGGGGGVRNLFIQVPGSISPFAAVRAEGHANGYAPDGLEIDNLWITYQSTGRWSYGLFLDGAPRGAPIVFGTLSVAPGSNVLTASGASYGNNQFANGRVQVRFTSGAAVGQTRLITANTSNTITMASSLSPNAAAGDAFVVETVLYGLRDCHISKVITFGTTTDALMIRNVRGSSFSTILCNGVGGTSKISLIGNSSGASERNDGIDFLGAVFGQLLINNTNAFNGFCTPQGGINHGGGITNSSLLIATAYKSAGPSSPPIAGLDLP
ncbi:hypothetical protein [Bosea sp. 2RAB26]|uniref:hypothetical protein n=1 Tax=Bosea sp. 2RAB26 TaxID=3237476 RepID=UPI003F915EF6